MTDPALETALRARLCPNGRLCGIDEAGRGPWAGPVVAAAVVLGPDGGPPGLADSKALSAGRRETLHALLVSGAAVGIGIATVEEIDRLNVLRANDLAMGRALAALPEPADAAVIDGNRVPPDLGCRAEALVKGDARLACIAAASIVAKVTRDRIMADLAREHPGYGWERNAGYGTAEHRAALLRLGVTTVHRRSFRPIHNILCEQTRINT